MEKKNNISTIEKIFIKTGTIVAVRCWNGGGMHELDIHLPNVHFANWDRAQSIKCRTSSLHFTDYTPATWSAAEKTCTLFIDTSHRGLGSLWAQKQQANNPFYYLKTEAEKHYPVTGKQLIFLGDATGIGHFSALQQLAANGTKISGFIVFENHQTATAFTENCPWLPLQTVINREALYQYAGQWIQQQPEKESFAFFIVGNSHLTVKLRRMLKQHGINGSLIKSKGFWQ